MPKIEQWTDVNGAMAIGVAMALESLIRLFPGVTLIHDGSGPSQRFGEEVSSSDVYTKVYGVSGVLVEKEIFKPGAKIKFVYNMRCCKGWMKIGVDSINDEAARKSIEAEALNIIQQEGMINAAQ